MAKDYYQILGVARDATNDEIKKAFRHIARTTHPDANPGDPESEARFRDAAEAYEVLSDPDRRRRYDRGDTIDLFGEGGRAKRQPYEDARSGFHFECGLCTVGGLLDADRPRLRGAQRDAVCKGHTHEWIRTVSLEDHGFQ